jgi:hypothetical protein
MKNIMESSETFDAYAEIDLCYYLLKMLYENVSKEIAPINKMVDDATGKTQSELTENRETAINLLTRIITAKKIIEADYSGDETMLSKLLLIDKVVGC